jgi:hypothetical protein
MPQTAFMPRVEKVLQIDDDFVIGQGALSNRYSTTLEANGAVTLRGLLTRSSGDHLGAVWAFGNRQKVAVTSDYWL